MRIQLQIDGKRLQRRFHSDSPATVLWSLLASAVGDVDPHLQGNYLMQTRPMPGQPATSLRLEEVRANGTTLQAAGLHPSASLTATKIEGIEHLV